METLFYGVCCVLMKGFDELDKPKEYRDPQIMFLFWGLIIFVFVVLLIAEVNG